MSFSSWSFLLFFSVFSVLYGCNTKLFKSIFLNKILLFTASCVFYLWAGLKNFPFLLFTIITGFFGGILSETRKSEKQKNIILVFVILINLFMLIVFKYTNFLISTINSILHGKVHFSTVSLILPLGISFYVFQLISYLLDVKRGIIKAERNLLNFALYLLYFPQLIQGPIERYGNLAKEFNVLPSFDYIRITNGLKRIGWGLLKKLYIADFFGLYVNDVYSNVQSASSLSIILATVFYAVQIYADFSGYMDVAIGASEILGIKISENFNHPYFSKTIAEFWRRWHITLGAWFKDYLFYPVFRSCNDKMGKKLRKHGYKKLSKKLPQVISLIVVWSSTGLWHGASWTFVLWGLWHGFFIIIESLFEKKSNQVKTKLGITDSSGFAFFQVIRTFIIVCIGYSFFRANSFTDLCIIIIKVSFIFSEISQLVSNYFALNHNEFREYFREVFMLINFNYHDMLKAFIIIIVLTIISFNTQNKTGFEIVSSKNILIRWILYSIVILLSFSALIDLNSGLHTSFIYNQF